MPLPRSRGRIRQKKNYVDFIAFKESWKEVGDSVAK